MNFLENNARRHLMLSRISRVYLFVFVSVLTIPPLDAQEKKYGLSCFQTWRLPNYPELAIRGSINKTFRLDLKISETNGSIAIKLLADTSNDQLAYELFKSSILRSLSSVNVAEDCLGKSFRVNLIYQLHRRSTTVDLLSPVEIDFLNGVVKINAYYNDIIPD